jgi:hypothetical protein
VSPEEDALRRALALLDHHAIPYMLTGSVAASFHGRPRATHNADVVIDPDRAEQLEAFVSDLLGGRWAATLGLDDLWRRVQSPTSDLIDL